MITEHRGSLRLELDGGTARCHTDSNAYRIGRETRPAGPIFDADEEALAHALFGLAAGLR
jgi:hypothetical protein